MKALLLRSRFLNSSSIHPANLFVAGSLRLVLNNDFRMGYDYYPIVCLPGVNIVREVRSVYHG